MAEQAVEPQRAANPADNLAEWFDKQTREADPTPSADQNATEAKPADPNVTPPPAPTPAVDPLDAVLPEDFEHGFFRNKPVREMYKSFRATEAEMQRAQRDAKEQRDAVERLRAEVAAKDVAVQMAAEVRRASEAQADPYAEVESLWFENPRMAAAKLQELTLAQAKQAIQAETQSSRQESAAQTQKRELIEQGGRAYDEARASLQLDTNTWNKRAKAVLVELTDPNGPYYAQGGPMVRDNYVSAYREIFGDVAMSSSQPPPVVVAAPAANNPPGSKKAAIGAAPVNAGLPTASAEKRKAWTQLAESVGVNPESYIQRMLQAEQQRSR